MDVLEWLESLQKHPHACTGHEQAVSVCVRTLCRTWRLCKTGGRFFTGDQARAYHRNTMRFLLSYRILNIVAGMDGHRTWALVPKFHAFDHLATSAMRTRRNPGSHWCFGDESYVGKMRNVVPHIRAGRKVSLRILQRHYSGAKLRLAREQRFKPGSAAAFRAARR